MASQPFQIWDTLGWVTIPGTVIAVSCFHHRVVFSRCGAHTTLALAHDPQSFIFFGFLVAGEEIESMFLPVSAAVHLSSDRHACELCRSIRYVQSLQHSFCSLLTHSRSILPIYM